MLARAGVRLAGIRSIAARPATAAAARCPLGLRGPPRHITRPHARGWCPSRANAAAHVDSGDAGAAAALDDLLLGSSRTTSAAHRVWRAHLRPGDSAVDATAGNGHDALALARLCLTESAGRLTAIDIQGAAIDATRDRLAAALSPAQFGRVVFVSADHAVALRSLAAASPGTARLVAFNLGYLPGNHGLNHGLDHGLSHGPTTAPATTVAALESALALLSPGGLACLCLYVGHPGGAAEADAVTSLAERLPAAEFTAVVQGVVNRAAAPRLLLIRKREGR